MRPHILFLSLAACSGPQGSTQVVLKPLQPQTSPDTSNASNPDNNDDPTEPIEEPVEPELVEDPPVAVIDGPVEGFPGDTITLDGSGSYDPQGYDINSYVWECSNGAAGTDKQLVVTLDEEALSCSLTVASSSGLEGLAEKNVNVLEDIPDWTMMVYIAGDNNLEDAGIEDINEMEIAGSTDDVNILVQYDRSPEYSQAEGNWHGSRRYRIQQDNSDSIASEVLEDLGTIDSGDYQKVIDFVQWSADNYPAKKYGLVIWNHGWSWSIMPGLQKGIASDDSTGNSISVANGDLQIILESSKEIIGQNLEVIGFDACIMQGWEIAHVSAPYANYQIASQDYEGWDGWEYTGAMLDLIENPDMNGEELGESVAYHFSETGDLTQSVIDLSQLAAFEVALDTFADTMIEQQNYASFHQAVNRVYSYDGVSDHDLYGLLNVISVRTNNEEIKRTAEEARDLLDSVITSNYINPEQIEGAYGLSIYSPRRNTWGVDGLPQYREASWSAESRWDDLLNVLY